MVSLMLSVGNRDYLFGRVSNRWATSLRRLLYSQESATYWGAAHSLRRTSPAVQKVLIELIARHPAGDRQEAIMEAIRPVNRRYCRRFLARVLLDQHQHYSPAVRAVALERLCYCKVKNRYNWVRLALQSEDPLTRWGALSAIPIPGDQRELKRLIQGLFNDSAQVYGVRLSVYAMEAYIGMRPSDTINKDLKRQIELGGDVFTTES